MKRTPPPPKPRLSRSPRKPPTTARPSACACLTDPTSVGGLRPLAGAHSDWHVRLLAGRPTVPRIDPSATVPELLRSGLIDRLYPRSTGDLHRVYADRGAAGRLVRAFEGVRARDVDEDCIQSWVAGEGESGASTRRRDAGLLRAAIVAFHAAVGTRSELGSRARPSAPRRSSPPQAPPPDAILRTMRSADLDGRFAVGLALGVGATPAEIVALTRDQVVSLPRDWPWVLLGSGERKRPVAVPFWLVGVFKDAGARDWPRQGARPVLRPDLRPDQLHALLVQASHRAGVGGGVVTMTRLRATWQALVCPQGAMRAVIRGRWALPPAAQRRPATDWPHPASDIYAPTLQLARGWRTLSDPPGGWPQHTLKRPSGRLRFDEPERPASRRPLPDSVR